MNAIVERAAKALWDRREAYWAAGPCGAQARPFPAQGEYRAQVIADVQTVIEAMREPTEGMLEAGQLVTLPPMFGDLTQAVWSAMIENALIP